MLLSITPIIPICPNHSHMERVGFKMHPVSPPAASCQRTVLSLEICTVLVHFMTFHAYCMVCDNVCIHKTARCTQMTLDNGLIKDNAWVLMLSGRQRPASCQKRGPLCNTICGLYKGEGRLYFPICVPQLVWLPASLPGAQFFWCFSIIPSEYP